MNLIITTGAHSYRSLVPGDIAVAEANTIRLTTDFDAVASVDGGAPRATQTVLSGRHKVTVTDVDGESLTFELVLPHKTALELRASRYNPNRGAYTRWYRWHRDVERERERHAYHLANGARSEARRKYESEQQSA